MSDDGKNDPLPRLSRERATRWAEEHTARMAEAAGVELDRKSAESIFEECVGRNDEVVRDGRYSLYYTVYAPAPKERHTEVVRKVRADFEKEGYRIAGYREYQDDYYTAVVDAVDDDTRFSLSAESAGPARKPSRTILFSVRSPCMIPPGATQQPQ
ncbi:hypothetical protein LO771_16470 [Streptacidiphilus sp. ASG 303]|uniref:hypothetical protein n=1 Tax=Streptacidiphilus sp. ASG 303 TaxID=2896847 RepID=UPI001E485F15|nr:hypothetical protein [Streptacidiphilus sp. ASG 303]MCD0483945.1 hypothetical protein [Streptacidiphilus sp. ASG 303]